MNDMPVLPTACVEVLESHLQPSHDKDPANPKRWIVDKEATTKGKYNAAKSFLATVKRYTRVKKLTPEILRELVDKIFIHHRQRADGVDEQKIEIFYNCVGTMEIPDLKKIPQTEIHIPTRKGVAISYSPNQQGINF